MAYSDSLQNKQPRYVKVEVADGIAVITLNRPPLNLLSSEVYEQLGEVLTQMERAEDVRVVILTGEGEKAFCAGADVREFAEFNQTTGFYYSARNQAVRNQLWKFPRPVIAAINGHALGGGYVLALVCDFRIASTEATFGLGEINMGIIGGTQYAVRMLPPGIAKFLIYTGEAIPAPEALRLGLVDQVVPASQVIPAARALAQKIASKSPRVLAYAKKVMNSCYSKTLEEGLAAELECLRNLWGTEDKNEGVKAFLEKRKPIFKGY